MGTRVSAFWISTIGSVVLDVSKLNDSDSTLVCASMLVFSAGWGTPILIFGPKYAVFTPGTGPGST